MTTLHDLYNCVQTRPRPEDVAELVLEMLGKCLNPEERHALDLAAMYSFT